MKIFIRKFSEKTFFHTLKFLSGTADIVSVRTKNLSDGEQDSPTGRGPNPRWTGCQTTTKTKVTRKDSGDFIPHSEWMEPL